MLIISKESSYCLSLSDDPPSQQDWKPRFISISVSVSEMSSTLVYGFTPLIRGLGINLKQNYGRSKLLRRSHFNAPLVIRAKIQYVSASEAKKLATEEGYIILDIRDEKQYNRAHIKSCHHIPLFIENKDNDMGTIIKRTLHNNFSGLFFGKPFTKPNDDFVNLVEQQFPKDSKLLIVCQEGLRSGVAARKLEAAGYQNLSYITSGLQSVEPGTFEKKGTLELQDAGKAGLVTIQGKISIVLGTILIIALLFVTIFPDLAEKLLQVDTPSLQ